MDIIRRSSQIGCASKAIRTATRALAHGAKQGFDDTVFDGQEIPREITPRTWLQEGAVHQTRILTKVLETTRYLKGPHANIIRDDIRRTTWAAVVEGSRLLLCEVSGPRPAAFPPARFERVLVAEGDIWRYHLALNKFTGKVTVAWIARSNQRHRLFLDGREIDTSAKDVDFPYFEYAQVPVGRIPREAPRFGILTYKCRNTGRIFVRRLSGDEVGPEIPVEVGFTLGGASLAISRDRVLLRVDELRDDKLVPVLIESSDGGFSFGTPRPMNLNGYEADFEVMPGYTAPTLDKGYGLHVPIFASNGRESVALNHVLERNVLVESIRVAGGSPTGSLEVFPSTMGSRSSYGNGITDGHGLIMVLGTEGRLYSSNSSAGGVHFPESALLNREMPQIAAFDASECYSSGLTPNYVSMDYLYIEAGEDGQAVSPVLHIETWDMPLPLPGARAHSMGSQVFLTILNDADLEPGKVVVGFDDPSINVTEVEVKDLRHAVIRTDTKDLAGQRMWFDVQTLFHRHHGEAIVDTVKETDVQSC